MIDNRFLYSEQNKVVECGEIPIITRLLSWFIFFIDFVEKSIIINAMSIFFKGKEYDEKTFEEIKSLKTKRKKNKKIKNENIYDFRYLENKWSKLYNKLMT